jgi:hypothetical protein
MTIATGAPLQLDVVTCSKRPRDRQLPQIDAARAGDIPPHLFGEVESNIPANFDSRWYSFRFQT